MGQFELGILLAVLSVYSTWFIVTIMRIHFLIVMPFMTRIHAPNSMAVITDQEHDNVHDKYEQYEFRVRACNWGTVIAVTSALLFYAMQLYEGDGTLIGYAMAISFAFVLANYNLGTSTIRWCIACENQILARIIQKNSDAEGFSSLGDYLRSENHKMIQEWTEEVVKVGEEFESRLKELGYDPEYDYEQSLEDEDRLLQMLE